MHATRLFTALLVSFFVSATADSLEAQTITHVPLYTFHGDSESDQFGSSVSGAGDINGDGRADLIVGARADDDNGNRSGSVRVFSGIDGSVLYNFNGDAGNFFGNSVSGAGDVNGDGTPDLIVGAPSIFNNGTTSGYARVLSGSDGSVLYNFDGDNIDDRFGDSVSGAGDVNGDGRADLIVGTNAGDTIVGIGPDATRTVSLRGSARVLSGSDGSVLYNFDGDDSLGFSVSGAGDVNGDGRDDLIVGVPRNDISAINGSAQVLSGIDGSVLYNFDGDGSDFGSLVSSAGDVNGDGFADLIVSAGVGSVGVFSGIDGSVLYTFDGGADNFFDFSLSCAGDVNGDGMADMIIGAPRDEDDIDMGSAHVLSGIDGSVLYTFDGDNENDEFGGEVSGAGDVNGDGIDDFIVGARRGGANGGGYARVFVSQGSVPISGDFDGDGDVDGDDVDFYIGNLEQPATGELAQLDLNGFGKVTITDHNLHVTTRVMTSNGVTGALLGDVNLDGVVDVLKDGFTLVGSLGQSVTSRSQGDLNADGLVDVLGDALILVAQLGLSNDP